MPDAIDVPRISFGVMAANFSMMRRWVSAFACGGGFKEGAVRERLIPILWG
jgi:hypothetical protein